jgi:YD repeat-containing protein
MGALFRADSAPTAASPTVVCSVPAGYPLYVEWKYSSANSSGYYAITGADRGKMITTTVAKAIGWTAITNSGVTSDMSTTSAIIMVLGRVTAYQYTADFDANMSETGRSNGAGVYQGHKTFGDPNDPFRPSQVTNANGQATSYTWDQFGNCKTALTPRGTTTTSTLSYANFPLGELTQVQQGGKTASALTYYEPSGLIHTIAAPQPGTSGSGQTVTSTWTYDALGNVLTEVGPGNGAATTITTTFNYTTDGGYSQAAAIRQPLTKTDNLGHVTHMRYDSRANSAMMLNNVGGWAYLCRDLPTALDYFQRGLDLREEVFPDSLEVADSLSNLSLVYLHWKNLSLAREYQSRALFIREIQVPDTLLHAISLYNLGLIALEEGNLTEAEALQTRAACTGSGYTARRYRTTPGVGDLPETAIAGTTGRALRV